MLWVKSPGVYGRVPNERLARRLLLVIGARERDGQGDRQRTRERTVNNQLTPEQSEMARILLARVWDATWISATAESRAAKFHPGGELSNSIEQFLDEIGYPEDPKTRD